MNNFKVAILILIALSASRFIPHPPNFTSLIALSFYVPCILGLKYIPIIILSFAFTDLIIGFHSTIFFTWGSTLLIGLTSIYFGKSIFTRLFGVTGGALIFFIISNFGVWTLGSYGYTLQGFINCYVLAIPFFGQTLVATILYSLVIEAILAVYKFKYLKT